MSLLIDATSLHPSTRLALAALEWLEDRIAPTNILEIGCGNGILSLTADQLWQARILACDISANAIADCTANIAHFSPESSITALRSDGFKHPEIRARARYGMVIANLLAQWQVAMAADIAGCLEPGGVALLSGILLWQEDGVAAAMKTANINIIQKFIENEWVCLVACAGEFTEL